MSRTPKSLKNRFKWPVGLMLGLCLLAGAFLVSRAQQTDDLSDPGPYQAGWQQVTITRPDSTTFTALLFYPATTAGQNAPYDGSGAPYPAISFGHGFLQTPDRYQSTLEHLATWGYFVIASQSYTGLFPSHPAFANDLRYCLDYLEARHQDPSSWLYQQVDTAHYGLSGHSMGGGASILAAAADTRIDVVANMAAAETNPSAIAAIANVQAPVILLAGSEDGIAPVEDHQQPMYDNANPPSEIPILQGGYHCGFMDYDVLFCDSGSMPRATQLAITRRWLTAVFNLYLKGDQTAWRPVWGPEVVSDPQVLTQSRPGSSLGPANPVGAGYPGQVVTYTLTVANQGIHTSSYTLFAEDNSWEVSFSPAQTGPLAPGASAEVIAAVQIPLGGGPDTDVALISARTDHDNGTRVYTTLTTQRLAPPDTDTPSPTASPTNTPWPTETSTPSPTPTFSPTQTPTPTPAGTASPTSTPTPTNTPTAGLRYLIKLPMLRK